MTAHTAPRTRFLSTLRVRLSSAISGLVLLCTVACVTGSVLFLQHGLTVRAHSDLERTLSGVSGYVLNQRSDLLGAARLVAADQAVVSAAQQNNSQGLIVRLLPYYADLNVDVIDVLDRSGRVLVRMENTSFRGDSLLALSSVRTALAGHEPWGLESDPTQQDPASRFALRATVPLRSVSRIIGAVAVGRQLSSVYAAHIKRAANAQVNLIAGGRLTGTTLTDSYGLPATTTPEPGSVLQRIAEGKPSIAQITESGRPVYSGVVPLLDPTGRPAGGIEVVSSLSPLYDLITQLSFLLIALGAAVVVLGTVLGLALARRLTRRLLALEDTASRVAQVAQSDAPLAEMHPALDVSGDDEVASLARSLGSMMGALDTRMEANAQLYAAAQARVRELSGLAEIARLLTAMPSVRETLNLLAEHVCRLIGCAGVAILLPEDRPHPLIMGGYGLPDGFEAMAGAVLSAPPSGGNETGPQEAMRTGQIVFRRLDQLSAELPADLAMVKAAVDAAGFGGSTAVPLQVQGRVVGTMLCYTVAPTPFSPSDISLLETIADQVAVAVENARLSARSRELAAMEERSRLARELHDSVTQAIFSMTLHARTAQLSLTREGLSPDSVLGQSVAELLQLTQGALAEMRALIFELRPGALADEGLGAALMKHSAAVSAREGIAIHVDAPEERIGLDPADEENLYRLAQEALHNAVKHANAQHAHIRVQHDAKGRLVVEISDDGVGFDPAAVPPGHLGLATMADRARQVRGTLELLSAPGQGTTVRAIVPTPAGDVPTNGEPAVASSGA